MHCTALNPLGLNRLHWRGYLRDLENTTRPSHRVLIAYIGGVICGFFFSLLGE